MRLCGPRVLDRAFLYLMFDRGITLATIQTQPCNPEVQALRILASLRQFVAVLGDYDLDVTREVS